MKKSIQAVFRFVLPLALMLGGCSPAATAVPPTATSLPTATAVATATAAPTLAPSPTTAAGCVDPALKLVSWWRAEGNTADSAGEHDGIFVSNTVYAPGKVGRAFSFNGLDNLVVVPDSDEWTLGSSDFSLDMWVNFSSIQPRMAFVGHDEGGGSTNKWIFWYDEFGDDRSPGSALRFHINPTNGLRNPIFAKWTPSVGKWFHVAITRSASKYALYIDGARAAASVHTAVITDAAAPLTIGSSEGFFFHGLIDEVHFFARGLSVSEIQKIYAAGSAGICGLEPAAEPSISTTAPEPSATEPVPTNVPMTSTVLEPSATAPVPTALPRPSATAGFVTSATLTPLPTAMQACPLAPEARLKVGDRARVIPAGGLPTRLRSAPEAGDNLIAALTDGTELKIIGGPVCTLRPGRADAYVYWQVLVVSTSQQGWVAEGDADAYYIEPWP